MYPFVELALQNARCVGCERPLDIPCVAAFGLLTKDGPVPEQRSPRAMIHTLCSECGTLTVLTAPVDLPSLLAAVEEEYRRYGRRAERQSVNDKPGDQPGDPPAPIMPPEMIAPVFG